MAARENWGRSYKIDIGTPETVTTEVLDSKYIERIGVSSEGFPLLTTTTPSNALTMSNLSIDKRDKRGFTFILDSSRGLSSTDNTGSEKSTLTLYNLDEEYVDIMNQKGAVVRVYAGYNDEVTLAYAGSIAEVASMDEGSDKVYRIKCIDGGDAAYDTIGNISYTESVSEADVIRDLASKIPDTSVETMGLDFLAGKFTTGGYAFTGNTARNFEKMLRKNNLSSVRFNGKIVVVPYRLIPGSLDHEYIAKRNYQLTADVIKSIASISDNGTKSSADTKLKQGVSVNTFYIPIEVGQFFTIPKDASERFQGTYLVKKIRTKLESKGAMWDVAITGEIIS